MKPGTDLVPRDDDPNPASGTDAFADREYGALSEVHGTYFPEGA